MTGFEPASLALIYNLYYSQQVHTGKAVLNQRFVVETYDEEGKFRMKRYFVVREVSTVRIDLASEEGNKYRIYNDKTMNKHEAMILTEERPNEKIDVEAMNSSYVNGLGAGYRFTIEEYGYDRVKIRDEEHRKTYDYKISL